MKRKKNESLLLILFALVLTAIDQLYSCVLSMENKCCGCNASALVASYITQPPLNGKHFGWSSDIRWHYNAQLTEIVYDPTGGLTVGTEKRNGLIPDPEYQQTLAKLF